MIRLEPPRGVPEGVEAWRILGLDRRRLVRFIRRARACVNLPGRVEVLLSSDAVLRHLNREYRGKDKATDVLSFPAPADIAHDHAGDLAVSLDTAARQAREHGHSVEAEVRVLLLHGMLHLHGMDHEADTGEMAAREAELREALKLPQGLIARTMPSSRASGTGRATSRTTTSPSKSVTAVTKRKAAR